LNFYWLLAESRGKALYSLILEYICVFIIKVKINACVGFKFRF